MLKFHANIFAGTVYGSKLFCKKDCCLSINLFKENGAGLPFFKKCRIKNKELINIRFSVLNFLTVVGMTSQR